MLGTHIQAKLVLSTLEFKTNHQNHSRKAWKESLYTIIQQFNIALRQLQQSDGKHFYFVKELVLSTFKYLVFNCSNQKTLDLWAVLVAKFLFKP